MPQPDTLLEGKYEIVSKLREGGMGTIYLVRHRLLDRIRVIKVMRPHASADPDLRRRFLDEARTATRLNHPNLCTIHDFAIDDDATAYLVMEFIEGVNVAELLGLQGPPGVPMSLEIAHQALLALGYLHRQNVVHRDVAPDNLMVSKTEDGRPLVKVIDLGIAKTADRPTEMTATGVFLGKLRYASPELAGSLGPAEKLDGRSDLYSLGIVLYELLTGARPFTGASPAELLRGQLFNPPVPFAQSDPNGRIPASLRAVVLKALEKKREDRFASAEEFDQAILAIQSGLATPGDVESTRALLSEIPAILLASSGPVTPSAQSRIDHQFAPGTTPLPATPHLTMAPTVSATPTPPPAQRLPASPRPPESSRRAPWVLAVIAAAVAAASVLLLRHRSAQPTAETRGTALRISPAAVAAPAATATQPPPVPTLAPSPEPAATLAPQPEASVVKPTRLAETRARRAPSPARQALRVPPTAVLEAAELPRPVIPTPPEKPPASVVVVAPPTPPSASPATLESERIRDAIRRYEKAQSTLDAELYARIFPSADRERIARAFLSLASQSVEFEIRRIQVDPSGTQARVEGYEKRTAVPRAGTEQRVSGERVLSLEKRADGWVIVRIS